MHGQNLLHNTYMSGADCYEFKPDKFIILAISENRQTNYP